VKGVYIMAKKLKPSKDFSPTFNRLIEICEAKNITISNLLDEFATSRSAINAWKNGNINTSILPEIAKKLNVSIDYLLTGMEKKIKEIEVTNGNEKIMLDLFRQLNENEQNRIIGRLECMVEQSYESKNKEAI